MSADHHDELGGAHEHLEDNHAAAYAVSNDAPLDATPEYGFWRSLRELEGKATFQTDRRNNELPPAPDVVDPMSRRNFFQLMGASMALAGVAGCKRYEAEDIVPLARRPEDQVPGTTQQYATACDLGGVGHALFATSFEGRPIKLDGNPEHPFASGGVVTNTKVHAGCSTFVQASVLGLYDPDRSQTPLQGGKPSSFEAFRAALPQLRTALTNASVLSESSSSPTIAALKLELTRKYNVRWYEYEPLSWDNERLGMKLAFGRYYRPLARLDRAETIVAIDADLFADHPASMRYSRDFARSRRSDGTLGIGKMNRLYSIESTFSHTGAMADHRLAVRSELGLPFALALDNAIGGRSGMPDAAFLKDVKVQKFLAVLAEELRLNKGKAVVIAGRRQSPEVHAVVARINETLNAIGNTLDYIEDPDRDRVDHRSAITSLSRELAAGKVETLLILGGNPVYDAPADLDFAGGLRKVRTSVHLHEYQNETSQVASWHVPRAHFLEAWGDVRTWDGTITVAQPLIAPLYGGLSVIELLAMLIDVDPHGDKLVQNTHKDVDWRQSVHDGYVQKSALASVPNPAVVEFAVGTLTATQRAGTNPKTAGELIEITFQFSSFSYDGRFANNAWMQETPDFLTKVTWDNYALVGPETAEALGLANDTMINIKVGDRDVDIACYTMPGQARNSITLVLGGGRSHAGRVGGSTADDRRVGWNTYKVRTSQGFDYTLDNVKVTSTGKKYELASIQEHWDIRTGIRPNVNQDGIQERLPELIRSATNDQLQKDATWRAEEGSEYWDDGHVGGGRHLSLFKEKEYPGHRWGMAIDLSTCTGCNSCMVACQAENNVPVVGRKEILNNREMSWIRIDRYFSGPPDDPIVVHQPVGCQHCENAPCEQVCPVGATQHSDEGLNDMAYNRCIGTRYCANNCPYKVRRFNFLDWNKEWREARNKVRRLLFNPEVTVRMRGVMEKCTFCVQRIEGAKIHARAQVRRGQRTVVQGGPPDGITDGEILTACQQACPTEAIVFGDLADKSSRVSRLHEDRRGYALLPETYTKPRNRFLARIRNPNPKLTPPSSGAAHGGHE